MNVKTEFLNTVPVMPSQNIERDIAWYQQQMGFAVTSYDKMYACLARENLEIHLQWHADTKEDPLLGGSVIKLFVQNIEPIFEEFVARGTVSKSNLRLKTPWNTNEFGFYDLNKNAIFIVEDA